MEDDSVSAKLRTTKPWVGIDFDGTLAEFTGYIHSPIHFGKPIQRIISFTRKLLLRGVNVKVFTARAAVNHNVPEANRLAGIAAIQAWTKKHLGVALEVTCCKDNLMVALVDDRVIPVEPNTGKFLIRDAAVQKLLNHGVPKECLANKDDEYMPMKSKAQRRYLHAKDPALAKKFEKKTPNGKKLPERVKKTKAKKGKK